MMKQCEGTGGTFQAALDDAINKAIAEQQASGGKTDSMIAWKLVNTSGQKGGIASIAAITVRIEYRG